VLEKTFLHIPGIGAKTELELWQSGIRTWQDLGGFFTRPVAMSCGLRRRLEEHIPQSIDAMRRKDANFFTRLSGLGEGWRLFPEFASQCVFLDIETTGLSPVFDKVTMVGLYEGNRYRAFIEGQNLEDLPAELKKYS